MTNINIGILAHVDAGKTTLTEAILYYIGKLRELGRVDQGNAYLDNNAIERERGITIFSKQAVFQMGGIQFTLLDTPGHVDFSAEMERTLNVLDYAILLVSGSDGIQGHTRTLWKLLKIYEVPTFIFVNKMDQPGADANQIMKQLKSTFGDSCIRFDHGETETYFDEIALTGEDLLNKYLETGAISDSVLKTHIFNRGIFPVYFGSALRMEGVGTLIEDFKHFIKTPDYPRAFSAQVFKVTRDENGQKLAHLKVTGGVLNVKDSLNTSTWMGKVNQIRLYSGDKYELLQEAPAGCVCAVTGLDEAKSGDVFGNEDPLDAGLLEPVLQYKLVYPETETPRTMMPVLKQLEEESPELGVVWNEALQEIQVKLMGEIQTEVLQRQLLDRFGHQVSFIEGNVLYKETISTLVEGVGHFEPLRHYAEVHLLMEPGEPGSGLDFQSIVSEDLLPKNWQNLILTHLKEKDHKGVLTGSPITDLRILVVGGRAHNKHTEGGDFREATYRAVRQGLMEAESVLLEPYYAFELELPEEAVGRAMTDVEKMYGKSEITETNSGLAILKGRAPVSTIRNYQREVVAYTKGNGRLFLRFDGYGICHNSEEVISKFGYDPEADFENPSSSVFCTKGSGFLVPWYDVKDHMHVEAWLKKKGEPISEAGVSAQNASSASISLEEIDRIIQDAMGANQGKKPVQRKRKSIRELSLSTEIIRTAPLAKNRENLDKYLLVDGYNIIFSWEELSDLAKENLESARIKLLEILDDYQATAPYKIMVVFDAYKVKNRVADQELYKNIIVIYTGEAQTADQYIEKFAHANKNTYHITVATSDGMQQMIIRGAGSDLLSARELKNTVEMEKESVDSKINDNRNQLQNRKGSLLGDFLKEKD